MDAELAQAPAAPESVPPTDTAVVKVPDGSPLMAPCSRVRRGTAP